MDKFKVYISTKEPTPQLYTVAVPIKGYVIVESESIEDAINKALSHVSTIEYPQWPAEWWAVTKVVKLRGENTITIEKQFAVIGL